MSDDDASDHHDLIALEQGECPPVNSVSVIISSATNKLQEKENVGDDDERERDEDDEVCWRKRPRPASIDMDDIDDHYNHHQQSQREHHHRRRARKKKTATVEHEECEIERKCQDGKKGKEADHDKDLGNDTEHGSEHSGSGNSSDASNDTEEFKFSQYYHELIKFKKKFGHCNVFQKSSKSSNADSDINQLRLYEWCLKKRDAYRMYQELGVNLRTDITGNDGCTGENSEDDMLPEEILEEIRKLDEIGFQWESETEEYTPSGNLASESESELELELEEQFHHNSAVDENEEGFQESSPCSSSTCSDTHTSKQESEKSWHQYFHDLKIFKSKFGHCSVPHQSSRLRELYQWCNHQRKGYREYHGGISTRVGNGNNYVIDKERINRLQDIGFQWDDSQNTTRK